MSDTELQENPPEETAEEEKEREQNPDLGAFLRREREKQGLTPEQIARMTRVRRYLIEALEDEQWDRLPPPVFVKGFVKSYAQALSLDETLILGLYEDAAGTASVEPRALVEPPKRKHRRVLWCLLFLCALGVAAYLYWTKTDIQFTGAPAEEKTLLPETKSESPAPAGLETESESSGHESPAHPVEGAEEKNDEILIPEEAFVLEKDQGPAFAVEGPTPDSPAAGDETGIVGYVLQAAVLEKTWVKIYVDHEDPQEFIFQPGTSLRWKAEKGFNLIVGNAAGIELDFNGKRVDDLGNAGEVIRLFLPKDFRSDKYEE